MFRNCQFNGIQTVSLLNFIKFSGKMCLSKRKPIYNSEEGYHFFSLEKRPSIKRTEEFEAHNPLNRDYKIASKASSRLKFELSDLIDHDQTGFLKSRSIAENICLINNVIPYTHLKDIPGLLFFIDFEKSFDIIEWTFV